MPGVVPAVPLRPIPPPRFRLIRALAWYARVRFELWRLRRAIGAAKQKEKSVCSSE